MTFTVLVLAVIFLSYHADAASFDCPTPRSPENGQAFFYQDGKTVKYVCDPGFTLLGEVFVYCNDKEWSAETPQCLHKEDISASPSNKDGQKPTNSPPLDRPLFNWDPENVTANNISDSDMLQDEARLHMILYPEGDHRRHHSRSLRFRTAAVRVQSATELEEEQKKRSQGEKPVLPSVIYVRKPLAPGKVLIQEDSLRRQYEIAALRLAGDPDPDVAMVSLPRAAVSTDDKSGQSEEALRQMYIMAQDYMYPRQAVVDPSRNPVVLSLSESQIHWINSLHPELRDRYLRDMYNTRAKEAAEGARAQEFLRRYEDAYHTLYNRPYYVRQPLAVMVEDLIPSYDYTCYQADTDGRTNFVRPPKIPNAFYALRRRSNPNHPYQEYLTAVYRCRSGYRMRDSRMQEVHCSQKAWYGPRPICDPVAE